jgi:hypothetical protein
MILIQSIKVILKKIIMRKSRKQAVAEVQKRFNTMVEVFGLIPSQYETAKIAIKYAVKEVADPENHEDAVIASAFDFLSGYERAKAEHHPINEA